MHIARIARSVAPRLGRALPALMLIAGLHGQAQAQSGAACPIGAPVIKTDTSYTITNNDQCLALVFSAGSLVTVTLPAANRVAPGFQVMLISTGGGISLTSSGSGSSINPSSVNGAPTSAVVGQGQSATLYGDGTNYFLGLGSGFIMGAPSGSSFTNLSSVFPGVLLGNSPTVMVPDGVLQITNTASITPSADAQRVCTYAPRGIGAERNQQAAFLTIFDWLNRPYRIPLCP